VLEYWGQSGFANMVQYQREENTQVTCRVEHKLEALVANVTAEGSV
jgi:hypothetical protein